MLQLIRSKATSLAAKLLFGVLIIAFGAGIWSNAGDMFRSRLGDTSVAHVGSRKIEPNDLRKEVQDMSNQLSQRFKGPLTPEQLRELGVVDAALQRLINQDLIELEVKRMSLAVGDNQLNQIIRSVPAFRNERGDFDPAIYRALVNQRHMSSQQYEAELRNEVVESQLDQALIAGVSPPSALVDPLYRSSAERRTADIMTIPVSAVPVPATPSDADIQAYYDKHTNKTKDEDQRPDPEAAALSVPELRSFSVALLQVEDVAAQIRVPEEKLRAEYDQRQDEFRTKAEGHFEQIVLPDEGRAKEAEAALAEGKDFAAVAADVAHEAKDTLDIGTFKKGELLPQLNEPAFALKTGETTQPIQTSFGWHILHAVEMKPEMVKPFDEVKEQLAKEVALDEAGDQIATTVKHIEDALAAGTSLGDIAAKFGMTTVTVENVDANGHDAEGKLVTLPGGTEARKILDAAFHRSVGPVGPASTLDELGESSYFLLQVDKITPETPKPLEAVKGTIIETLQQQQRSAALLALAKEATDAVNAGKTLAAVAEEKKLAVTTSPPLARRGGDAKLPPVLVSQIFATKPGSAVYARTSDGYVVAQVKEILPPDAAQQETQAPQFAAQQVTPALQQDILEEFQSALHQRFPVTINTEAVDAFGRTD